MSSAAPTKRDYPTNTLPSGKGVLDWLKPFVTSSVGMKVTTAVTGILLTGFVIVHLIGNLKVLPALGGQEAINAYAKFLKDLGPLLWIARGALLAVFVLHIYLGLTLAMRAGAARPVPYQHPATIQASRASVTMHWTGLFLLAFVLFHLAHFTFGWVSTTEALDPATSQRVQANYLSLVDAKGRHDVYSMMVAGFRNPIVAGVYVVAMGFLYMHLSHGIGSIFQTLGLNTPRLQPFVSGLSRTLAFLVAAGNSWIVIAVQTGLVPDATTKMVGH
ncbi:MAG TPA: succinate dehydrogenase cytochrome b subunit [Gemmataceae bacterium]|nr:succinate dehydrogenase cytochrome b subunit [Gemmataceae bacterium]